MFIFANLILALGKILDILLSAYMWVIIISALISWVNPDPYNPIVRFLYNVTEPVLSYLRQRFPLVYGGLDLSPLVVMAAVIFLKVFLVGTLMSYSMRLIHGGVG